MNEELEQTAEQTEEQIHTMDDSAQFDSADELRQADESAEDEDKSEDPDEEDDDTDEEDSDDEEEPDDDELFEVKARDAEIEEIKGCEVGNTPSLSKKRHTGILFGTVETYECDPEEDCPECQTRQVCQKCQGDGTVTCPHCDGHQECPTCHGNGQVSCSKCGGAMHQVQGRRICKMQDLLGKGLR